MKYLHWWEMDPSGSLSERSGTAKYIQGLGVMPMVVGARRFQNRFRRLNGLLSGCMAKIVGIGGIRYPNLSVDPLRSCRIPTVPSRIVWYTDFQSMESRIGRAVTSDKGL